jgi:hypothetical protein
VVFAACLVPKNAIAAAGALSIRKGRPCRPSRELTRPAALCCVFVQVFLWPVGVIFLALPFAVLTGFNPTRFVLNIYFR